MNIEIKTKPDHDINFHETKDGEDIVETMTEEDKEKTYIHGTDWAIEQFSRKSLRNETNQFGTNGYKFKLDPPVAAISSEKAYSDKLRTARHPVQDFWVYDGAEKTIGHNGKINTSIYQILPDKRIHEKDAIEWNRVGSKKGWMFNGNPRQSYGFKGEDKPTHTSDGFIDSIRNNKWAPLQRSQEKQGRATRDFPLIDMENNARGIGLTGAGKGSGGMSGGYKEVNQARLKRLAIPNPKYNWTGSRLTGTGREDQSLRHGAGGFRSGYRSMYPDRPQFPTKKTNGISKVMK